MMQFKRVGKNCFKRFYWSCWNNTLAAYLEYIFFFEEELKIKKDILFDDEYQNYYINPIIYMAFVNFCYRTKGWVSSSQAQNTGNISSAALALAYMEDKNNLYNIHLSEDDFDTAKKAIAWAQNIPENTRNNNNYLYNIWAISYKEGLSYRDLGFFASILSS
jgi:hypothetical protein